MDLKKLQALYGLKWNPFTPDLPIEALQISEQFESFFYRIENLVMDGGFAACIGEPGLGKSAVLRLLNDRLGRLPKIIVGELTRPQCSVNDFYRELGELFEVSLKPANRYGGHQALRTKWRNHIETTLFRPVLLMDEAQSLNTAVINELKALSSDRFDTQMLLTVILAGDLRLADMLNTPELKPIDSRLRYRLTLTSWTFEDLTEFLVEALRKAGAPSLMTPELINTLADKAMGNLRSLMTLANNCLTEAVRKELTILDEKLFLELAGLASAGNARRKSQRTHRQTNGERYVRN